MDNAANFIYGTVTTAPSPAASGTSMVVTLLGGGVLPAAPFNCTVWITGVGPLASNAEIIRVTAASQVGAVATLSTIVRAQETTSARTIVVGDQFALTITAKLISDIVTELAAKSATLNDAGAGESLIADAALAKIKKLIAGSNVTLTPAADGITLSVSAPGTGDVVGPAGATDNFPALFDGATGKLLKEAGAALGTAAFQNTGAFDPAGSAADAQAAAIAASLQKSANLSDVANAATAFGAIKQAATTSATGVVELATDGESAANIVPQANDSRLSDARTPTAHAASHVTGGADIIPAATTTASGLTPIATAPAAGLLNVLAIGNGEAVRTDKALFDTTNPAALGTAAPGTSLIAARRDHVHPMPTVTGAITLSSAGATTVKVEYGAAISDETTALTTGLKLTTRLGFAMSLTSVFASVTTAPTGSTLILDIKLNGTTIFSTKPTIDATEKSTATAATPAVLSASPTAIAADDEITVFLDQVGATIAGAGGKVVLIGTRS